MGADRPPIGQKDSFYHMSSFARAPETISHLFGHHILFCPQSLVACSKSQGGHIFSEAREPGESLNPRLGLSYESTFAWHLLHEPIPLKFSERLAYSDTADTIPFAQLSFGKHPVSGRQLPTLNLVPDQVRQLAVHGDHRTRPNLIQLHPSR